MATPCGWLLGTEHLIGPRYIRMACVRRGSHLYTMRCDGSNALTFIHPNRCAGGFDAFETAELLQSATTVIRHPIELLGHPAAGALFANFVDGSSIVPKRIVLPVNRIVLGSC